MDLGNLDTTVDEGSIENLNEKKKQFIDDKLCLNRAQEQTENDFTESSGFKLVNMIGNTDVKEMPVNPFDFIWNTKSLIPRNNDGKIVLNEEDIHKLSRNKSVLGARVDASDKLQKISINELVLQTSSVAETENGQENKVNDNKMGKKTKKKKDKKQSSKTKKATEKICDDSAFLVAETKSNDTSEINLPQEVKVSQE